MEREENKKVDEKKEDILEEYNAQIESDDIHFEHYDWTYNDGSGCCC